MKRFRSYLCTAAVFRLAILATGQVQAADQLPSWNDSRSKTAITKFIEEVTNEDSPDFVPPRDRIATIDNDGTLWSEQPVYFQALYVFDRIKELEANHPEWKDKEPFASVLKDDMKSALAGGEKALLEMTMATHAGLTAAEFSRSAKQWLSTARHPTSGRLFTEMVFQPMLELINYLHDNEFKVFIVSGGGIDFVRVFSEEVYGIPPERVIGSSIDAKYEIRDGKPVIIKLPKIDLIDDHAGKPVGIHRYIGQRPILAVGNSDGDFEMLEWTTAGEGPRLGAIVHHDDTKREWSYDRKSNIGRLARGLDQGPDRGWQIISIKDDWKIVHPPAR